MLQVLELLQSTSIPNQPVTPAIPSDLQPLPTGQDEKLHAVDTASLPTSRPTTSQPGKTGSQTGSKPAGKGAGGRMSSAAHTKTQHASSAAAAAAAAALAAAGGVGGPAAPEAPVVPLAKHMSSIIDASKQEVEAVATAYYAAKVCLACRSVLWLSYDLRVVQQAAEGIAHGTMHGI